MNEFLTYLLPVFVPASVILPLTTWHLYKKDPDDLAWKALRKISIIVIVLTVLIINGAPHPTS